MVKGQERQVETNIRFRTGQGTDSVPSVPPVIRSTKHPLVKAIRALEDSRHRRAERRLVIEGTRMLEEAQAAGVAIRILLYDPAVAADARAAAVLARARAAKVELVPAHSRVVAAASQVKSPQGMIAIVEAPLVDVANLLHAPRLVLVVGDRLQDPGNAGTLIRLADATGATGVVLTAGSVDPHHPKVLRATAGSIFHLPVAIAPAGALIAQLQDAGVRVLAADQAGAVDYSDVDFRPPVALVFGNEGAGLDSPWTAIATAVVRIPIYGRADSLNVAVAAGILLYEVRRQLHQTR